jgi:hypothetical protein
MVGGSGKGPFTSCFFTPWFLDEPLEIVPFLTGESLTDFFFFWPSDELSDEITMMSCSGGGSFTSFFVPWLFDEVSCEF